MIKYTVKVQNRAGIHARPAMVLVKTTLNFKSSINIEKEGNLINAKSILGVITLAATFGTELTIIADGEDEKEAIAAVLALFNNKFEEEEWASG